MTPEFLASLGVKALIELARSLLDQGRVLAARDAIEELARREIFEAAQREKPSIWRRIFGGRK